MKLFLVTIFTTICSQSLSIEFAHGDHFYVDELHGEVTMVCPALKGQVKKVTFTCVQETLSPVSFDYITDQTLDADILIINYLNENDEKMEHTVYYDSSSKKTLVRVNLWQGQTLTPAILHFGKNTLQFTAKKKGLTVRRNRQIVYVENGQKKNCRPRSYYIPDATICEDQFYSCAQYFNDENFCN